MEYEGGRRQIWGSRWGFLPSSSRPWFFPSGSSLLFFTCDFFFNALVLRFLAQSNPIGVARPNRDDNEIEQVSGSKHRVTRSDKGRIFMLNDAWNGTVGNRNQKRKNGEEHVLPLEVDGGDKKVGLRGNGDANGLVNLNRDSNGHGHGLGLGLGVSSVAPLPEQKEEEEGVIEDVKVDMHAEGEESAGRGFHGPSGMKYGLTENSGLVPLIYDLWG